jgi:eukaryotic-like serine/threonine-protein kinase
VPNLKGLTYEEAIDVLGDADLNYEVSDSIFMPNAKPFTVLSNFPKSGLKVKSDRKIYLTLAASSAPMVKMPNITGRSVSSAKNQLLSSGLQFGGEEKMAALEENTVLKIKVNDTEVVPGSPVAKGSKVILVVGDGYGNQFIEVPNVVGMAVDEAEVLLSGLGLSIGNIIYENSDKAAGIVLKQNPSSGEGSKIKNGAPVNIWVSGTPTTDNTDTPIDNN